MRKHRSRRRNRRGASAVEFAIVAVPLVLFTFGSIEFCRALMAVHSLEEAARAGCRVAVLKGATTADVEQEVNRILDVSGISGSTTTVEPAQFSAAERYDPITVMVTASFDNITWIPVPQTLGSMTLDSTCTLPKESAAD